MTTPVTPDSAANENQVALDDAKANMSATVAATTEGGGGSTPPSPPESRVRVDGWTCAYCGVTRNGHYEVMWRDDGKVFCSYTCEIKFRTRLEREATRS